MEDRRYTIQELSEMTGFSLRTIRYYVQEGLIAPPAGRNQGGFYFDSQLNQLKQIKSLQEKGLKPSSIVQRLNLGKDSSLHSSFSSLDSVRISEEVCYISY